MPVITHNLMSQFANRQLNITSNNKLKSLEKLSSGYRINRAGDDAAGLAISEKMRWQIRGLDRASRNIEDGKSLLNVADGALTEVHRMLQRMNELTIQAANDTNTYADRSAIQQEINQLLQAIEKVNTDTRFNTQPVFDSGNVKTTDTINDVTLSLPQGIEMVINASNIDLLLHKNADGSYELEDGHTYTLDSDITMTTFHVSSGATVAVKDSSLEDCGIVCDNATLYISDVSIKSTYTYIPSQEPPDPWGYNGAPVTCNGSTTVNFLGDNYLKGGTYWEEVYFSDYVSSTAVCSGWPGIRVEGGNHLTLNGNGTLTAATEGSFCYCAAIGSSAQAGFNNLSHNPIRAGDITIHSGYINAIGDAMGAGIGGGRMRVNGDINIDGGFVHAEGGCGLGIEGVGIGSGGLGTQGETPGTISISGGTVEAFGGRESAGIGGGRGTSGSNVVISGGTVLAKGGEGGAGIGSGHNLDFGFLSSGDITISGGNVTAIGSRVNEFTAVTSGYEEAFAIGMGGLRVGRNTSEQDWFDGFGKLTIDGRTEDMYIEGSSNKNADGRYIFTYEDSHSQTGDSQKEKGLWWIQMGATEGNGIFISTGSISRQDLGLDDLEVYSHQKAGFAVTKVQNAIDKVSAIRSHIGAQFNRLEHGGAHRRRYGGKYTGSGIPHQGHRYGVRVCRPVHTRYFTTGGRVHACSGKPDF